MEDLEFFCYFCWKIGGGGRQIISPWDREWASEQKSEFCEQVAQYFHLDSWLFWTIVSRWPFWSKCGKRWLVSFHLSNPQWARSTKNTDWSTGPLARPFARSLAPLTRSLAPDYSLRSRPPLRSLVRSLAHFAHFLARGKVNFGCLKMTWFCPIVQW